MFRLKTNGGTTEYKKMRDMKPCEICRVIDEGPYHLDIVMRTASTNRFEVMNLSNPGPDRYWGASTALCVEPLDKGEEIILVIE